MPKRIVDGDALWKSGKLSKVEPESYRAEYANLLPLALANGTFECDARSIWAMVYAFNRPTITPEIVEAILTEFERVDLLRRWEQDGKVWAYWTGIDKPGSGRLPSPSQMKDHKWQVGPTVPEEVANRYRQSVGTSQVEDGYAAGRLGLGLGLGFCFGSGIGTGVGVQGKGKGQEQGNPKVKRAAATQDQKEKAKSKAVGSPVPKQEQPHNDFAEACDVCSAPATYVVGFSNYCDQHYQKETSHAH